MANPLIRNLEQFGALSHAEKAALQAATGMVRDFAPDQDLVRDGDRPRDCKLILEGVACGYKLLGDGRRQIISFHIAGDFIDLQGLLMGAMDHSIGSLTPGRMAVVSHATMLDLTETSPRIARALWRTTLLDAAVFRQWIVGLGRRSAYARIAHLLCELCVRLKAVGLSQDGSYDLPVTQAELADALGLSTVHVNRTLQALRRHSLIMLRGGKLTIADWEGLKAAGEFDPHYLVAGRKNDANGRSGWLPSGPEPSGVSPEL
jgi:CRP-like cAMP-binding protein